jgi:DNA repair protein RadC
MKEDSFTLSEIQISYIPKIPTLNKAKITCSEDAYKQFLLLLDHNQFHIREEAAVLFLNRANRVIGGYKLSVGGITGTVMDIRIILGIALKSLSCGIIIAHTHPSGELKPSKGDIDLTKKLKEAARFMEIEILDHLIITSDAYISMAEEGIL